MVWIQEGSETIITSNTFRTHIFTTTGTFNANVLRPGRVEVLVVGGGGAGGGGSNFSPGGGGGGGGVIYIPNHYINTGNISVVVGNGGIGSSNGLVLPTNGENSAFESIIAIGGGHGGHGGNLGNTGGCGGGGGRYSLGGSSTKIIGLGNNGGLSAGVLHSTGGGGGGGGALQNGGNSGSGRGGNGGEGYTFNLVGSNVVYGSGGGGGRRDTSAGTGGTNAGNGGFSSPGDNGVSNTGGGGGGGMSRGETDQLINLSGNGGSGIVVVKYDTANYSPSNELGFSGIQSLWGGENPIFFSEYYADAVDSPVGGISGIPKTGNELFASQFINKPKNQIVASYDTRYNISYSNDTPLAFKDISGNSNDLIFNSSPTYNTSPFRITLTNSTRAISSIGVPFNLTTGFTLELLFQFSANTGNTPRIFSYAGGDSSNGIQIQLTSSSNLYLHNTSVGNFTSSVVLNANTWYHAIITSTDLCYINGVQSATTGTTGTITNVARTISVGDQAATNSLEGSIAFVSMYNYAQSVNEIASSYEGAKTLYSTYNI